MADKLIIFGTGSMALNAFFNFKYYSNFDVVAFTANSSDISKSIFEGLIIYPFESIEDKFPPSGYKMFIAPGVTNRNTTRETKYKQAKTKGYRLATFIHPSVACFPDLIIGDNCFVAANTTIQPHVVIRNNVIVNDSCIIGNHTVIRNNCYIGSGSAISGYVEIEENASLGENTTITDKIKIGQRSVIGAGVTMLEDSKADEAYNAPRPEKELPKV